MPNSTLDGPSWEPGHEPDGWVPPELELEPEHAPSLRAHRQDWADHAVATGAVPPGDVADMTKAEIVEQVAEASAPEPEAPAAAGAPAPAAAPKGAPVRPRGKDEVTGSGGVTVPKPAAGDGS